MEDAYCPQLVGGFNPFEKHARQIGSCHQIAVLVQIKNASNHSLVCIYILYAKGLTFSHLHIKNRSKIQGAPPV